MFNDVILLQFFIILILFFFNLSINILSSWYLAGLYLASLGYFLLLDDCDIFIGFLWVLDLGVGLIFFIFILHLSNFLFLHVINNINSKFIFYFFTLSLFLLLLLFFVANPVDWNFNSFFKKHWFLYISHYDYYLLFSMYGLIDLNVAKEIYFHINSFEFFLINFVALYGIILSILGLFLLKRILIFSNINNYLNINTFSKMNSVYFLRTQNFIKQKNTSAGLRVWSKKKI